MGGGGLNCSQAVAAGMLPAPCPCVPWWDGFPQDPAQGEWQEQILAQILAVSWKALTHTLEKTYPVLECWMCGFPLCQLARRGLGLHRKGTVLPSSLGTGRFDTLATDWKQCKGGPFSQLDYNLESLCQSWKGEGHVGWARRHQTSGFGFCWCWWWLLWCCQVKSGHLLWWGQRLKRSEGISRPWTRCQHQAWQQSSFLPPVWLWPEALLALQNILLLRLPVLLMGKIAHFPFFLPTS